MCRKNCKWDVWGEGGKASIWGGATAPLSQCSYVPAAVPSVVCTIARCYIAVG